jgi:DeoR family ulaG and ulaABCDEF operon transcriptional repressor
VLVDSSKFEQRSSLVLCPLERISTVITDDGIPDARPPCWTQADIKLIVAQSGKALEGGRGRAS